MRQAPTSGYSCSNAEGNPLLGEVATGEDGGDMANMSVSVVIRRPVDEVFAYLSDTRNNVQWQTNSGLQTIQQIPDGPMGVGTRITETRKFMGMTIKSTSEISEFEPNRKFTRVPVGNDSSPIKRGELSFAPESDGCRVTFNGQIEASGLLVVAEPVLVANMKRSFEEGLNEAKSYLEQRG